MRFDCTKAVQTFTAIANKRYVIDLIGASGYCEMYSNSGFGGHVQAIYSNTTNTTLNIYVGGTPNEDTWYTGGYNGGGNGGAANSTPNADGYITFRGGGGGGATDIRVGGTNVNNRIMVAGGGGGDGLYSNGGYGGSYPDGNFVNWSKGSYTDSRMGIYYNNGMPGTLTSGGAAGAAPTHIMEYSYDYSASTYYRASGGGGGGGYYGGGGGSSGLIAKNRATGTVKDTGLAGTAGSLGQGGSGGGCTSGVSGYGTHDSGSGGGGSSYIATNAQISYPSYDQCYNDKLKDGYALISEVISAPTIKNVRQENDKIYVTVSKEIREDNKDIEERFYYTWSLDNDYFVKKKSPKSSVVVLNEEEVDIVYTISSGLASGHHMLYFYITSADNQNTSTFYDFEWKAAEPTITFNEDVLSQVLIQGTEILNVFTGTGLYSDAKNIIYEYQLIINDKEYGELKTGSSRSMILPYIYDGVYDSEYDIQFKVRMGHMMKGKNDTKGKEIWTKWFTSDKYRVIAPIIPINRVKFNNKLSDKAIEIDTKLNISWDVDPDLLTRSIRTEYILYLYREDELVFEENYGQRTEATLIMSYPQGENYRFAIALLQDKSFLSDKNYSESFQIADIETDNKVHLLDGMRLVTSLNETFDRIEVAINGEVDFIRKDNVDEVIPDWKFLIGHNIVDVYIYLTETIYVKHTFKVYIYAKQENISIIETHSFNTYASVNNEKNYTELIHTDSSPIQLGISEEAYECQINEDVVKEVNQKFVIQNKTNSHDLKIFEIFGNLD